MLYSYDERVHKENGWAAWINISAVFYWRNLVEFLLIYWTLFFLLCMIELFILTEICYRNDTSYTTFEIGVLHDF